MDDRSRLVSFPTSLGWMAIMLRPASFHQGVLERIFLGYRSREAILGHPDARGESVLPNEFERGLIARFQDYFDDRQAHADSAATKRHDFTDLSLDWKSMTPFARQVSEACRQIPHGAVVTYGQLARRVGSPHSYRAVGGVMSRNPFPIVVPCHRVIAANGGMGGFSAPGGIDTKRALLELEGLELQGLELKGLELEGLELEGIEPRTRTTRPLCAPAPGDWGAPGLGPNRSARRTAATTR